ncbi:MAG: flagellar motor protein MotB, partial [Solirubrobacteraceae bacterium]
SHEHAGEHENEERWLLTYADMITLLMTLFMVMFAISSVNTAKMEALSKSLSEAISGKIVTGGPNIQEKGATEETEQASPEPAVPAIQPAVNIDSESSAAKSAKQGAAEREEEEFRKLKAEIDQYAKEHGLESSLQTDITRRGLVVRLLTDRVVFASGQAHLQPSSVGLLTKLSNLLITEVRHPITVEGHTDDQPISSGAFATNWELSTARATQVVRFFVRTGVAPHRLQAAGSAAQRPVASNSSESGRSRNRRVEIVLVRLNAPSTSQDGP